MNKEQKEKLEKTLSAANELTQRIARLEEAILNVTGKQKNGRPTTHICIPLSEEGIFGYTTDDKTQGFCRICWRDSEQGIIDELRSAVVDILQNRLDKAKEEYNAL